MSELRIVPTPIHEELPLEEVAKKELLENALTEKVLLLVEEHKIARQRWLRWGLPREAIDKFILFNEHTQARLVPEITQKIREGYLVYLMSDCGLPAFCDPGQELVNACHNYHLKVSATPFPNSVILALALSGFSHHRFIFSGFIPVKSPEREEWIKRELKQSSTMIWMDTPYRLTKLLDDLIRIVPKRPVFLACDLNSPEERLFRGSPERVLQLLGDKIKREFILVISGGTAT